MLTATQMAQIVDFDAARLAEFKNNLGTVADSTATGQTPQVCIPVEMSFLLPDAATADYDFVLPEKLEVVDVTVIKDAAGAGNSITLKTGAGTAISDAIAAAVDKTVTRAGTLDKATRVIASGGTLRITNTRAAGSSACYVLVKFLRRA